MDSSIDELKATVSASGIKGLVVSSAYRPGSITSSGNVSYHAKAQAIDVTGSGQSMTAYATWMKSTYGSRLKELIYLSPQGPICIHNGKEYVYSAGVLADHRDHVHVAALPGFSGGQPTTMPVVNPSTPVTAIDTATDSLKAISNTYNFLRSKDGPFRIFLVMTGIGLIYISVSSITIKSGIRAAENFL